MNWAEEAAGSVIGFLVELCSREIEAILWRFVYRLFLILQWLVFT